MIKDDRIVWKLSKEEADMLIFWFEQVREHNKDALSHKDYNLIAFVYRSIGRKIPYYITTKN